MAESDEAKRRAQLIRAYEAACHIGYPTDQDTNFRLALSKELGRGFGLKEVREYRIDGPGAQRPVQTTETPAGRKGGK